MTTSSISLPSCRHRPPRKKEAGLGLEDLQTCGPRAQPVTRAHECAHGLDELSSGARQAAIAAVREPDGAGERLGEPDRAPRARRLDDQAARERDTGPC